jgi:hypothetical protein
MLAFVNAMYGGLGQSTGALLGGNLQGKVGTEVMFRRFGWGCLSYAGIVALVFEGKSWLGYGRMDSIEKSSPTKKQ